MQFIQDGRVVFGVQRKEHGYHVNGETNHVKDKIPQIFGPPTIVVGVVRGESELSLLLRGSPWTTTTLSFVTATTTTASSSSSTSHECQRIFVFPFLQIIAVIFRTPTTFTTLWMLIHRGVVVVVIVVPVVVVGFVVVVRFIVMS